MAEDRLKVVRVLVMEGPRSWVAQTLDKSWLAPERPVELPIGATAREDVRAIEVLQTREEQCICDGGPQGEGLLSILHEPHCPLAKDEQHG